MYFSRIFIYHQMPIYQTVKRGEEKGTSVLINPILFLEVYQNCELEISSIFLLEIGPISSGFLTENSIRPVYYSRKSSECTTCHTSLKRLLCRSTYKPFPAQLSRRFKSTMHYAIHYDKLNYYNALMQFVQIGRKFQCLNHAMLYNTDQD